MNFVMESPMRFANSRCLRPAIAVRKRMRMPGLAAFASLLTFSSLATAQGVGRDDAKVLHLLQEPRHRTVYKQDDLFLIDLQINPGDTTYAHTHNQAILRVRISDENGPLRGDVTSDTSYVRDPFTHTLHNDGVAIIHNVLLINDSNGVTRDTNDTPKGVTAEPVLENSWFRAYRIELSPGESTALQTHKNPTVIIQGTPGVLHVTRSDGITHELAKAGAWAWRDAGSAFAVHNTGDSTVVVAISEGRRQAR